MLMTISFISKGYHVFSITYLDSLLKKKNTNQHAKKFPGNPCKPRDDGASIDYCKKK